MKYILRILSSLDERAKWRATDFSRELTKSKLSDILAKEDISNLFVHFDNGVQDGAGRVQPQVSFNPKTTYATPIGIYAYPMSYVKNKLSPKGDEFGPKVEFAGDYKYIYIYKAKNPEDVYDLSKAGVDGMFEKTIFKLLQQNPDKEQDIISKLADALKDAKLEIDSKKKIYEAVVDKTNLNKYAPEIVKAIKQNGPAVGLIAKISKASPKVLAMAWWYFVYTFHGNNKAKVTLFLRKELQLKIVTDLGNGIIHGNEPTQAIIFSRAFIDTVAVELNPFRKNRGKRLEVPEKQFDFATFIKNSSLTDIKDKLNNLEKINMTLEQVLDIFMKPASTGFLLPEKKQILLFNFLLNKGLSTNNKKVLQYILLKAYTLNYNPQKRNEAFTKMLAVLQNDKAFLAKNMSNIISAIFAYGLMNAEAGKLLIDIVKKHDLSKEVRLVSKEKDQKQFLKALGSKYIKE